MKVIVSCDGDTSGDGWAGLTRAGLPSSGELLVLSVANVIPPDSAEEEDSQWPRPYLPPGVRRAHSRAAALLEQSRTCARTVGFRFQQMLPGWKVTTQAVAESPVWGVICVAARWKADLLLLRAPKMKSRSLLLDDTLKVIYEAPCSTHLLRHEGGRGVDSPLALIAVLEENSADSIVQTLTERVWPPGSVIRLIGPNGARAAQSTTLTQEAQVRLGATGLEVSKHEVEGDLRRAAVEEALSAGADLIFVGPCGHKRFRRPQASLSLHVAANAPCSVEVVHPRPLG